MPELNSSKNPLQAKGREVPEGIREVAACAEERSEGLGLRVSGLVSRRFRAAAATEKGRGTRVVVRAQVAERLMAADCKSAAPCELRRFESSPVHQDSEQ